MFIAIELRFGPAICTLPMKNCEDRFGTLDLDRDLGHLSPKVAQQGPQHHPTAAEAQGRNQDGKL